MSGSSGWRPGCSAPAAKQFASKDALIDEAFALAFEQSSGAWAEIIGDTVRTPLTGAPHALRELVEHYFALRHAEWNCPMLAFSTQARRSGSNSPVGQCYAAGFDGHLCRFVRAAGGQGPDEEPNGQELVLFAAMLGTGLLTQAMGRTPQLGRLQSAVLDDFPAAGS